MAKYEGNVTRMGTSSCLYRKNVGFCGPGCSAFLLRKSFQVTLQAAYRAPYRFAYKRDCRSRFRGHESLVSPRREKRLVIPASHPLCQLVQDVLFPSHRSANNPPRNDAWLRSQKNYPMSIRAGPSSCAAWPSQTRLFRFRLRFLIDGSGGFGSWKEGSNGYGFWFPFGF